MENKSDSTRQLVEECKTIEENCLYNAQAHFEIAARARRINIFLLIVPAALAGLGGLLVSLDLCAVANKAIGALTAILGAVATVSASLGVDRREDRHNQAANLFTALRHESRALYEAYASELPRDGFVAEVRRIGDRYNTLVEALPPTDECAFERARERIKSGRFVPDFRERQEPDKELK
jgi:hypothetical protein